MSRNESDPERLTFVRDLWKEVTLLQEDVLTSLRRPAPEARGSLRDLCRPSGRPTQDGSACSTNEF
jgi:hypothetical protein